jgi:hypothetical protein
MKEVSNKCGHKHIHKRRRKGKTHINMKVQILSTYKRDGKKCYTIVSIKAQQFKSEHVFLLSNCFDLTVDKFFHSQEPW